MFSWLKKYFIPHKENNHRPHILRKENIRSIIFVILFLEVFTFLLPTLTHINKNGGMAAVLPSILANLTNEERQIKKLDALTINPILNKAAEMKAEDMAKNGYFAHTSPEGKTPWYWLAQVGYRYQYAGENLAINFSDSKDVTNAWMNSPTHRANIVKDKYTEVGTGIATGIYEGKETVFVAQVYANPLTIDNVIPKVVKNIEKDKLSVTTPKIKVITTSTVSAVEKNNILGAETPEVSNSKEISVIKSNTIEKPTVLQNIVASPRNSTKTILFIILGIIILSIILNIFIKIKHHHPDLITNGLVTAAIIGAILITNSYIGNTSMKTIQSLDYSSENVQ
jgi:hypothetical protein